VISKDSPVHAPIIPGSTPLEDTWCTQRFRTDDVLVTWRD